MKYVLLFAILPMTRQQCLFGSTNNDHSNAKQSLIKGQQEFSIDLLKILHSIAPEENVFFSPYIIYQGLLIAYFLSANQTERELTNAFHLPRDQDKLSLLQAYSVEKVNRNVRLLKSSTDYKFDSANRLFLSAKNIVQDCIQDLFNTEIYRLEFTKTIQATNFINNWVEQRTKGRINTIIPYGILPENTQLLLVTGAYFKGFWKSKFLEQDTSVGVFYVSVEKRLLVPMMARNGTFKHGVSEKLSAHILELPYKGDEISMYLLLPPFLDSTGGVNRLLKKLNSESFDEIEKVLEPKHVEVMIPKFRMEETLPLKEIIRKFGVQMFRDADFRYLTGEKGIFFNDTFHKAVIEVDETGVKDNVSEVKENRTVKFICNHPFLFILFDKVSQYPLFVGVYSTTESKIVAGVSSGSGGRQR